MNPCAASAAPKLWRQRVMRVAFARTRAAEDGDDLAGVLLRPRLWLAIFPGGLICFSF